MEDSAHLIVARKQREIKRERQRQRQIEKPATRYISFKGTYPVAYFHQLGTNS
jgi:hypothetical protein